MAWPFLKLNISASSVTIIWLIIAAIGCGFVMLGNYTSMLIGTGLFELAVILDCVDGHIARFTRITRTGEILDMWAGEILLVSSILSIGIGLSNSSSASVIMSNTIMNLVKFDKIIFAYIGIIGALAAISSWTVRLHWRTIAMKLSLAEFEPDRGVNKSNVTSILDNVFHYSGALTFVMFVSAIIGTLELALAAITLVYVAYLFALVRRILQKARSLDSEGTANK